MAKVKKKSGMSLNTFRWLISVIFLVYGISMFKESILTGILSISLGLSACPLTWKFLDGNMKTNKLVKVLLPIILLVATSFSAPTTSTEAPIPLETTGIVKEAMASAKPLDVTEAQSINSTSETVTETITNSIEELKIYYIDIGQGDSTLITCDGEAMLIDSGQNDKGTEIQLFLKKNGVDRLKYIIGTHLDSDHIGGMDVILTKFDCDTVVLPDLEKDTATFRDVIDTMKYRNYKNTKPVAGNVYQLGDAKFTIISPNKEYQQDDHNNWSIGIKLEHGNNTFLFTGDAEKESESDILNNGIVISADVYKVAHHGSNTSTTDEFLNAVNPTYAVISCGKDNSYGHPHKETLDKLKSKGIKVFRTDEQGTIIASSDGEAIEWNISPSETWIPGIIKETEAETFTEAVVETTALAETVQEKQIYVLNTSSKKFHYPTCNGLPTNNRKDVTLSREEIISKGYVPCKRCNP